MSNPKCYVHLRKSANIVIVLGLQSVNSDHIFYFPEKYQQLDQHPFLKCSSTIQNAVNKMVDKRKIPISFNQALKQLYLDENGELFAYKGELLIDESEIQINQIKTKVRKSILQTNLNINFDDKFDQLNNDTLSMIFKELDLQQLIRIRRVCKRWLTVIDELIVIDEMILKNKEISNFNLKKWYWSQETIEKKNILRINNLDENHDLIFKKQLTNLKFLQNLKRIMITDVGDFNIKDFLGCIGKFQQLDQLELDLNQNLSNPRGLSLCHPKLRILSIKPAIHIELNLARLTILNCIGDLTKLKFIYPESLHHLTLDSLNGPFDSIVKVKFQDFLNLKSLEFCHLFVIGNSKPSKLLNKLQSLEHFVLYSEKFTRNSTTSTNRIKVFTKIKQYLIEMVEFKARKNLNCKILFDDIILNLNQFQEFDKKFLRSSASNLQIM